MLSLVHSDPVEWIKELSKVEEWPIAEVGSPPGGGG